MDKFESYLNISSNSRNNSIYLNYLDFCHDFSEIGVPLSSLCSLNH